MEKGFRKETDFYIRESENRFSEKETITLLLPEPFVYEKQDYDWYILVALEKADKVTKDRHLLTSDLIMQYRGAIRESYQKDLDIKMRFGHPNNRNTIQGIKSYIDRINKKVGQ